MEELGEAGGDPWRRFLGAGWEAKYTLKQDFKVCVFPVNEKESIVLFSN